MPLPAGLPMEREDEISSDESNVPLSAHSPRGSEMALSFDGLSTLSPNKEVTSYSYYHPQIWTKIQATELHDPGGNSDAVGKCWNPADQKLFIW